MKFTEADFDKPATPKKNLVNKAYAPHLPPDRWRLVAADPAGGWQQSAGGLRFRFQSYRRT